MKLTPLLSWSLLLVSVSMAGAQENRAAPSAAWQQLAKTLADDPQRDELRQALGRVLRRGIIQANQRSTAEWSKIESVKDWEAFRDEKIAALWASLGTLPERPQQPKLLVTGNLAGEGFQIRNVVYQSRPGLVVTANLYVPDPRRDSMPGILLSHSHHNPKHEGELQDIGMTWARAGCYVLVPDHLGHGERRQHPFASAADYAQEFPVGRQDYNFRYDTSLQLYLAGESLMGWMAHDLMTGVDVLLSQPGIDPKRIALLGAVAGGGDPAAVTAALDPRITCLVPFNFGGPQPENRYPLPADAETSFNYAGGGSWESTRNLARSAADGFLPWALVGSIAPRKLIHAHEFSWDRDRDPVWKRYERIWGLYDARDKLAFTTGFGTIQNTQAPASHCNNIGPPHRKLIHEAFRKWLAIDVSPEKEYKNRRTREELTCLTNEARREFNPQPLHEILALATRPRRPTSGEPNSHVRLAELLGRPDAFPKAPEVAAAVDDALWHEAGPLHWKVISRPFGEDADLADPCFRVVLLRNVERAKADRPTVVAIAGDGAQGFLKEREAEIEKLLTEGAMVALVDVRGTGCFASGQDRGQQSGLTSHSATAYMLGTTLLAGQVDDLRSALALLRSDADMGQRPVVLWGDSFAEPLGANEPFKFPRRVDRPAECDPAGPLLAIVTAHLEPQVAGVYARGGLASYASILESPFVQVPHAAISPGLLKRGDLPELVAALAPRSVVLEGLVDGRNRLVSNERATGAYAVATESYTTKNAAARLVICQRAAAGEDVTQVLQWAR
jgi:dienelactone hydrolase